MNKGMFRRGDKSQEEMLLHQGTFFQWFFNTFPKEFGQFVGALETSRHSDSSLPVIVVEALLESEVD